MLTSLLLPSSGVSVVQGNQIRHITVQFTYIRLQPPLPFFRSDRQNFTQMKQEMPRKYRMQLRQGELK